MKLGDLFLGTVLALGQKGKEDHSFWLFSSNENVHFDLNVRYLFEHVRENFPQIQPRFAVHDEALREKFSKE